MKYIIKSNLRLPSERDYEAVERKGITHPDTLADGIAESISIAYSKYCLKNFGVVLHHNVDKVNVMGGVIDMDWGKGRMLKPVRVLVNGRLSHSFGNKKIPIEAITELATKEYFKKVLPYLDVSKWLDIIHESTAYSKNPKWFNPRSLQDLPEHKNPFANDTSIVISYWPLTKAERLTILLEGFFYDSQDKPKYKYIGGDIKVMIVREKNFYEITMCIPFIINYLSGYDDYIMKLCEITKKLEKVSKDFLGKGNVFKLNINTQDQRVNNVKGYYFTVTGSAIDYGEEGVVGRGNNRWGIIPSFRPYSMEASWGKNPVYHVGKVYGVILDYIARKFFRKFRSSIELIAITNNGDPFFSPNKLIINVSDKNIPAKLIKEFIVKIMKKRDWTSRIINKNILVPRPNNF